MYKDDDFGNPGAYDCLQKLGRKITQDLKPDYILMVSAHWQSSAPNLIEVAVPPQPPRASAGSPDLGENPLIYDFYGFPDYMYKETFRSYNSRHVSEEVQKILKQNGFSLRLSERGIDHGAWVPSVVMFLEPRTTPKSRLEAATAQGSRPDLRIPLVQVSLTSSDADFDAHYKLGQALRQLRENRIYSPELGRYLDGLVICSGMSVHNLRDLGVALRLGKPMPYVKKFNHAISTALGKPDFLPAFKDIQASEKTLKQAHPTLEHLAPLVVAGGCVQDAHVKELYNDEQLSLGWGVYEFSDAQKQSRV